MNLTVCAENLTLDAERALFWPAKSTLLVADVHLGKGASFRRAGVPVPSGDSQRDLQRLAELIERYRPDRLLVLGDLFHTRLARGEPSWLGFERFRSAHAGLHIQAIRGNHDRAVGHLPAEWKLDWVTGALPDAPFVFSHHPGPSPLGYGIAGHLHPALRLKAGGDSIRLPVFWFRSDHSVLPSFGAFTGGWAITPDPGDRVVMASPEGLIELPGRRRCIS